MRHHIRFTTSTLVLRFGGVAMQHNRSVSLEEFVFGRLHSVFIPFSLRRTSRRPLSAPVRAAPTAHRCPDAEPRMAVPTVDGHSCL